MRERKGGLLNYSTTIPAERTVGEIQGLLARRGAKSILLDYDDEGNVESLSFLIQTNFGDRNYRLPANVEATWRTLVNHGKEKRLPPRFVSREQAARVAWRIIKDWLEAQLALIETEQVVLEQIMLPYMIDRQGRTVYELMVDHHLALGEGER